MLIIYIILGIILLTLILFINCSLILAKRCDEYLENKSKNN